MPKKKFKDIKIGDTVFFYYKGADKIKEREVVDIEQITNNTIKISLKDIGFIIDSIHINDEYKCNYFSNYESANKAFKKDLKQEIQGLKGSKRILDKRIQELRSRIKNN